MAEYTFPFSLSPPPRRFPWHSITAANLTINKVLPPTTTTRVFYSIWLPFPSPPPLCFIFLSALKWKEKKRKRKFLKSSASVDTQRKYINAFFFFFLESCKKSLPSSFSLLCRKENETATFYFSLFYFFLASRLHWVSRCVCCIIYLWAVEAVAILEDKASNDDKKK